MTPEEIGKTAFAEAEKEAKEKQVAEVKRIVTKTLEKLDNVRKSIKKYREEEHILEMDIEDLKQGKLDRIAERQEKDPEAKKVSVVLIIKEKVVIRETIDRVPSPWYFPYQVIWPQPVTPIFRTSPIYCESDNMHKCDSIATYSGGSSLMASGTSASVITCSVARDATVGAYDVNGHMVHLR